MGEADISATALLDSPRIRIMRNNKQYEVQKDVIDSVWALFGSAAHAVLDSVKTKPGFVTEERLFASVNGWTVSGQIDLQTEQQVGVKITDYKVTSVWSVILGQKREWSEQLNIYAWLREQNGVSVSALEICAILRDWSKRDAMNRPDYPQSPVVTIPVPLMTSTARHQFVSERVLAHQEADQTFDKTGKLPECSKEDRWERDPTYAVRKVGAKRATRVHTDRVKAEAHLRTAGNGFEIEYRRGARPRCEGDYCGFATICDQYANDLASDRIIEDFSPDKYDKEKP
jgi:hypothetical protein